MGTFRHIGSPWYWRGDTLGRESDGRGERLGWGRATRSANVGATHADQTGRLSGRGEHLIIDLVSNGGSPRVSIGGGDLLTRHAEQLDLGSVQEVERIGVDAVVVVVDDAHDAGVDQHLGALQAGEVGDVAVGALGGDAVQRRLDDGIGLSMDGTHAVTIDHKVTNFLAVGQAGGRAVEAGGQNALFAHQHGADEGAVAGASGGYVVSDLHEVGVPIWAHGCSSGW
jgi:hypothetical protein